MNNDQFSLIEFYHLPGFGVKEQAKIIVTSDFNKCDSLMHREIRINNLFGDAGYRYEIHSVESADKIVKKTNDLRKKDLAEFRHRVYGEPLTA